MQHWRLSASFWTQGSKQTATQGSAGLNTRVPSRIRRHHKPKVRLHLTKADCNQQRYASTTHSRSSGHLCHLLTGLVSFSAIQPPWRMTPVNAGFGRLCASLCASVFLFTLADHETEGRLAVTGRRGAFAGTPSRWPCTPSQRCQGHTCQSVWDSEPPLPSFFLGRPTPKIHTNCARYFFSCHACKHLMKKKKNTTSEPPAWTPVCLWGISLLVFDWLKQSRWCCTASV